jgi:alanyl-tRNA synthetase
MNAQEIRRHYLSFFKQRGHKEIARALLVPQNDPTTLFTGSGMQPLIPYLLGQTNPNGTRLTDSQTCLRAQDIEEVGDNRHTTFFEMLGNWSLGDYFKKEQLNWFFEFLVSDIGLDPKRIYVTCFSGYDKYKIPKDVESAQIWQDIFKKAGLDHAMLDLKTEKQGSLIGTKDARIFFYQHKNWWCRSGSIDTMPIDEPGGPDSEVFYLFDSIPHDLSYGPKCHPNCDCGRFIELGNSVFMEYLKTKSGFTKLPRKNVDYGGGLERIAAAAIDSPDVFKISLMWPIIEALEKLSHKSYAQETNSMRIITDHLRGALFLALDGVVPSNKEQGYVMRRLIRRAIRFSFKLGIENNFLDQISDVVIKLYEQDYPELKTQQVKLKDILNKEEKIFRQTLRKGIRELSKMKDQKITGSDLFRLQDTFGFPLELSLEEAFSQNIELDPKWRKQFDQLLIEQRTRSQTATKGAFKGGLGGDSLIHRKYHTATHLMYQALREVLGDHVIQHGSNITGERLRFDFSHPDKLTPDQINQVEAIVNEQIRADLNVSWEEYPTDIAMNEMHVLGAFGDRYGDRVKVYRMQAKDKDQPFSLEICGGPHVEHTGQLMDGNKKFKIIKEESSSAGIRRIKAVLS